jgi:hypothetical protein
VPIDYSVDHARRRIICVWAPPFETDEIVEVIERAAAEGIWSYGVLHDARAIEPRGILKVREMIERVKRLQELHGPRGPVAMVASGATVGPAQAYSILGDQAGQTTQVCWERDAAETWLDRHTSKS